MFPSDAGDLMSSPLCLSDAVSGRRVPLLAGPEMVASNMKIVVEVQ